MNHEVACLFQNCLPCGLRIPCPPQQDASVVLGTSRLHLFLELFPWDGIKGVSDRHVPRINKGKCFHDAGVFEPMTHAMYVYTHVCVHTYV